MDTRMFNLLSHICLTLCHFLRTSMTELTSEKFIPYRILDYRTTCSIPSGIQNAPDRQNKYQNSKIQSNFLGTIVKNDLKS